MIVIAQKPGQLANQIFLFAHFIAWSIEHGVPIANPTFDEYAQYFASTRGDWLCRYPVRRGGEPPHPWLRRLTHQSVYRSARLGARTGLPIPGAKVISIGFENEFDLRNPAFLRAARGGQCFLMQGWKFRDHTSFNQHAPALRAFFCPDELRKRNVERLVTRIRSEHPRIVGVHIRRGDYRQFAGGKYYFEFAQYANLMRQVREFPGNADAGFLICSNEPWAQHDFEGLPVYRATGHPIEDNLALSRCDAILGPPSTYSMWASFYGQTPHAMIEDTSDPMTPDQFRAFAE